MLVDHFAVSHRPEVGAAPVPGRPVESQIARLPCCGIAEVERVRFRQAQRVARDATTI
jgi:hypothetical protein